MDKILSNNSLWEKLSKINEPLNRLSTDQKAVSKDAYFNFKLFKVRKLSFVIVVLGLLVFILTVFCMKQQNNYTLLIN
ncbi:hypothetical protein JGH11_13210 [Dysgonomonas sp. Marseille-P4677]|uniref:hypothetical protein n=1 Tax=Dysgonomonas sp. Marseille-P4677 TaxID=2364790 RepID=UPI001913F06B|nr:hypothetical protein [Dysgonomonas sp. Marseille-P4677]MBK5721832.1 hypothetical protein [Dysgonomonas sp. Marseille-P4677]